jgi:hypothetical protein
MSCLLKFYEKIKCILLKQKNFQCDMISYLFSGGLTLQDFYMICSNKSNNLYIKFSRRIQILHKLVQLL